VQNGIGLLAAMLRNNIKQFIFSSTAACFGEPERVPIDESTPHQPTNPYGRGKSMFETILRDCSVAHGLRSISLRYFNACGATREHGEDHTPETHLIPIILEVAAGKRAQIAVFGTDYPTADGTCVRDYVHVADLADAHILALGALREGAETTAYNLGNGKGFSVLEIIEAVEKVTGQGIKRIDAERRAGDPARLIAASEKIQSALGWAPNFVEPEAIIRSAWDWHQANPDGYGKCL